MGNEQFPKHAVLVRWRTFQAGIYGWPAVVSLAVVGGLFVVVYLLNSLNYLPRVPR